MKSDLLSLRNLVWLAGALQFCQIPAMLASPRMLNWREDLAKLSAINRQIVVVIGGAIVLAGIGLGVVVVLCATEMVNGGRLGTALCGFLAIFWLYRDIVQIFLYSKIWPEGVAGKLSHYGLMVLFTFQVCAYSTAFLVALTKN